MFIAWIVRVDHHGGVAEHRLGAGGGDDEFAGTIGERVADVPHEAIFFLAYHFKVGNGGMQDRIPLTRRLPR